MINLKDYGFLNSLKIIFYEIKNVIIFDYSDLFYDQSDTKNTYEFTKKNIGSKKTRYDATYLPTPYFFLHIIKKRLEQFDIKKFTFLDFGCGAGRVLNFFSIDCDELIGIDKNSKYRRFIKKKNQKFLKINIDNVDNLRKIRSSNNKFILYFFNPFDIARILKVINYFIINEYQIIIITVNCAPLKFSKIKKIFNKKFLNKNIGISIYKNH